MEGKIVYRPPVTSDLDPMKLLMEQTFPISYGNKFFKSILDKSLASKSKSAVPGTGIYTVVATCSKAEALKRFQKYSSHKKKEDDIPKPVYSGELRCCDFETDKEDILVGQLSCRLVVGNLCEDEDVSKFQNQEGATLLYIMTLVTLPMFQRCGIGSELVSRCIAYGRADPGCIAVYLHVITYNESAVSFYRSKGFEYVTTVKDFYSINKKKYDSYIFKFQIRERPLSVSVASAARASAQRRRRRLNLSDKTPEQSWCVLN